MANQHNHIYLFLICFFLKIIDHSHLPFCWLLFPVALLLPISHFLTFHTPLALMNIPWLVARFCHPYSFPSLSGFYLPGRRKIKASLISFKKCTCLDILTDQLSTRWPKLFNCDLLHVVLQVQPGSIQLLFGCAPKLSEKHKSSKRTRVSPSCYLTENSESLQTLNCFSYCPSTFPTFLFLHLCTRSVLFPQPLVSAAVQKQNFSGQLFFD